MDRLHVPLSRRLNRTETALTRETDLTRAGDFSQRCVRLYPAIRFRDGPALTTSLRLISRTPTQAGSGHCMTGGENEFSRNDKACTTIGEDAYCLI